MFHQKTAVFLPGDASGGICLIGSGNSTRHSREESYEFGVSLREETGLNLLIMRLDEFVKNGEPLTEARAIQRRDQREQEAQQDAARRSASRSASVTR